MPPGAERDRSAESFASAVAQTFPREAWEWALSIGDSAGQLRAATERVGEVVTGAEKIAGEVRAGDRR